MIDGSHFGTLLHTASRFALLGVAILAPSISAAGSPINVAADETHWHQRLPIGRWAKIHEQRPGDDVRFVRQRHAGAAFDTRRGRLTLFGSDTHGLDWTNSPLFFDVATRVWHRAYRDDAVHSYAVNSEGIPVAGTRGDRPWAMHTFAALTYDAHHDALIVASYPQHLEPGRFTDAMVRLWPQIRRHPTWIYRLSSQTWAALPGEAVHFFPYATAYDSDRSVVIGYRADGIYELGGQPRRWRRITGPGLLGFHNNAVYDRANRALVVFGSNENSNDVVIYKPTTAEYRKMPTVGLRPPPAQYVPMAYHTRLRKTVLLAPRDAEDADARTETWTYDLGADEWKRVDSATLPFTLGMNYNLVYDSMREILLLVTGDDDQPTAVWALRLATNDRG